MKKIFILVFLPLVSQAQTDCDDPNRDPDVNHIVMSDYNPVCGCDGKTYRNDDAAYWWGGIDYWTSNTICDDFDIDLFPNVITPTSVVPAHLFIYMKYPGSAELTIYNDFGKLMFEKLFEATASEQMINEANPYELYPVEVFQRGLYILVVTVNGNRKYRKILRVTE